MPIKMSLQQWYTSSVGITEGSYIFPFIWMCSTLCQFSETFTQIAKELVFSQSSNDWTGTLKEIQLGSRPHRVFASSSKASSSKRRKSKVWEEKTLEGNVKEMKKKRTNRRKERCFHVLSCNSSPVDLIDIHLRKTKETNWKL